MRPDSVELADHAGSWAGAYVHIPFCARVCPYCDFNVVAGREDLTGRFVEAVLHEIELESPWNRLDSVAFGGVTPSRLSPVQLISILNGLRTRFGLADRAEVSIEVNPEDWTPSVADNLVAGASGVYLGQSTRIYDRETGEVSYGRVPAGSVVVPGNLPSADGKYSLYCAIIVKRVDAKTRAKTGLNDLLRNLD